MQENGICGSTAHGVSAVFLCVCLLFLLQVPGCPSALHMVILHSSSCPRCPRRLHCPPPRLCPAASEPGFHPALSLLASSDCLRDDALPPSVTEGGLVVFGHRLPAQCPIPSVIPLVEPLKAAMRLLRSGAGHGPRMGIEAHIALRPGKLHEPGTKHLRLLALTLLVVG